MAKSRPKVPDKDIKLLYGRAKGMCAFEDCREKLVEKDFGNSQIGEMGHIIAHSSEWTRGDPSYPKEKLEKYENLILLCPTCHKKVDIPDSKYSEQMLREIKRKHEEWVEHQIDKAMTEFSSAELATAIKDLSSAKYIQDYNPSFDSSITPEEKIKLNKLTEQSNRYITLGFMRYSEVKTYWAKRSQVSPDFTDNIKYSFQEKYKELKQIYDGDSLFEAMLKFAQGGTYDDFTQEAAGLAILCYLFIVCDVFEHDFTNEISI